MRQRTIWPDDYLNGLVDFWHDTEVDEMGFMEFMCRRLNWSPEEVSDWVSGNIIPNWWLRSWWTR